MTKHSFGQQSEQHELGLCMHKTHDNRPKAGGVYVYLHQCKGVLGESGMGVRGEQGPF